MKKIHDWYLPDYDIHYEQWMRTNNEKTYQRLQREYALARVKQFRKAIDIGGNIGFWSRDFCEKFDEVIIFEPDGSNIECLKNNLMSFKNFRLHEVGLGYKQEIKEFYTSPTTSGGHSFFRDQIFEENAGKSELQVKRLDDFNFTEVDLIKIDTQGSEYDILLGGQETLKNNDCVLNVEIEQKNEAQRRNQKQIIEFLDSIGYKEFGRSRKNEVVFTK